METDRRPYRPLYTQIQDALVCRIVEGEWRPGELLPSEQALALQLGVSQGTIRKATDALEAEKIIDRRQGKGTFVAELTQEQSVYRFFRLLRPDGRRIVPTSGNETVRLKPMGARAALALGVAAAAGTGNVLASPRAQCLGRIIARGTACVARTLASAARSAGRHRDSSFHRRSAHRCRGSNSPRGRADRRPRRSLPIAATNR
ncbi:MAG: GntR family transcriptional regulator [Gammaproteobacteria bacterium]|nr:GntR family transcriptional regulator [Gammaproteobacteria bacterium]